MRRGDFVIVALSGDYGKPRPALVIQSDSFSALKSIIVCPLTTTLLDNADMFRLTVEPTPENGLRETSQVSIDKTSAVPRAKVGQIIGVASEALLQEVATAISVFFGLV